jgi:hypothetical protein
MDFSAPLDDLQKRAAEAKASVRAAATESRDKPGSASTELRQTWTWQQKTQSSRPLTRLTALEASGPR